MWKNSPTQNFGTNYQNFVKYNRNVIWVERNI